MRNSKDSLEQIRHHKKRADEISKQIRNLEGELAVHKRAIKELDETRTARIKKKAFQKAMDDMIRKQNLVVAALRAIAKPSGAKDICNEMKRHGVDCHNSKFATLFLPHVMKDTRVVIERVHASKNLYSLKEWDL